MKYVKTKGATAIIAVDGPLGISNRRQIEDEFSTAQDNGCTEILYDFTKTTKVESVGIGLITSLNRQVKGKVKSKSANAILLRAFRSADLINDLNFIDQD